MTRSGLAETICSEFAVQESERIDTLLGNDFRNHISTVFRACHDAAEFADRGENNSCARLQAGDAAWRMIGHEHKLDLAQSGGERVHGQLRGVSGGLRQAANGLAHIFAIQVGCIGQRGAGKQFGQC